MDYIGPYGGYIPLFPTKNLCRYVSLPGAPLNPSGGHG